MLLRRLLVNTVVGSFLAAAYFPVIMASEHVDVAPIDGQIIQKIAPVPHSADADALDQILRRNVNEAGSILDQVVREGGEAGDAVSASQRMLLEGKLRELDTTRNELRVRLAGARTRLDALGVSEKTKAWNGLSLNVEQRLEKLYRAFETATAAKTKAQLKAGIAKVKIELQGLQSKDAAQQAATQQSPGASVATQNVPAQLNPSTEIAPAPQYLSYRQQGGDRVYAFRGSPLSVAPRPPGLMHVSLGGATLAALPDPTPAEATTCSYVAADLGESTDVQITPEIKALAESLGYSPARIFEYVSNEIKFEPYYGSLKGTMGTLYSKAGGVTDQSSLLVALLRASNIPARYVKGNIKLIDDARVLRWFGVKDYPGLEGVLKNGQFHGVRSITPDGKNLVYLDHVWVEACVPYGNYRGTRVDKSGHRWVPMDPSFKDKTYQSGIQTDVAFDYTDFMSKRSLDLPHEKYEKQVEQYIKSRPPRYSNNTLQDVPYRGAQVPRTVDILPTTLPYTVRQFLAWSAAGLSEIAEIPDFHRYKFNITVKSGGGTLLAPALTLSLPEVAIKRVTLSFNGATPTEQAALTAWKTNGDLTTPPLCTVNVVPVVKVEGLDRVTGSTATNSCASDNKVAVTITLADSIIPAGQPSENPSGTLNTHEFTGISGIGYYALQGYSFQASDRLLTERAARLLNSVKSISDPNTNQEETLGEYLHLVGLKYLRYATDAGKRIGELDGGSGEGGNHLALVGTTTKVKYLYDLPFAISRPGFEVQSRFDYRNVDLVTGASVWKDFELASYSIAALQTYIWQENARMDAVSPVRGIQFARETGVDVLTISSANQAAELGKLTSNANPALNYSPGNASYIQNLLNAGMVVTAPRSTLQYQDWAGAVWIMQKRDPLNYLLGFAMAGGEGGGRTVGEPVGVRYLSITGSGVNITTVTSVVNGVSPSTINSGVGQGASRYNTFSAGAINLATGNKYHPERDISIKGRGLPLVFERSYNSREAKDGPFGYGWTHNFNHYLRFEDANANGLADGADSDGRTSTIVWVDGTGAEKYVDVQGDVAGVAIGSPMTAPSGFYFQASRNHRRHILAA
jgi:transglutaminase-like putative cysteine protease